MVAMVRQRGDGDCGIAALAMALSLPYEDCYVAAAEHERRFRGKSGLYNRHLVAIASTLGVTLRPSRRFDLDDDEGVLRLRWTCERAEENPGGHFVAVRYALVFDPWDGCAYPWREYAERTRAKFCTLLKSDGG